MIALALLAALLAGCGSDGDGSSARAVATAERTWTDDTRATPATLTFPGAPTRTVRTRLWVPAAGARLPLLLMAHGFGGRPERFDPFARSIAAAGFVVAAPAFPLTNRDAPGGHETGLADYVNQPGDLSTVITALLAAAADRGDPLHGRIDPMAIAVLGHSLGGATALGLTRKACCTDARVAAAIYAGAPFGLTAGYGRDPLAALGPPALVLHGTADALVPFAVATDLFDRLAPPRLLLGLDGAGHGDFLEGEDLPSPGRAAAQRAVVAFLAAEFRGDDGELERVLAELGAVGHVVDAEW